MAVDILHTGHINIINTARDLGEVTIGILSDKAIMDYKRLPLMDIEKRKMQDIEKKQQKYILCIFYNSTSLWVL